MSRSDDRYGFEKIAIRSPSSYPTALLDPLANIQRGFVLEHEPTMANGPFGVSGCKCFDLAVKLSRDEILFANAHRRSKKAKTPQRLHSFSSFFFCLCYCSRPAMAGSVLDLR